MCEATSNGQPNRREVTAADLAVGKVYPWPLGERRIVAIDPDRALVDWTWRSTDPDSDTTKEHRNTSSIAEFVKDLNAGPRRVAAFTPGPWRVGRGAQGEPFAVESATRTVALVKMRGDSAEANARLIAASPSMHAVLSRLVAMCDAGYDMRDGDGAMHEVSIPLINDARALLAQIGGAQ
jgi:hypothetical protein